jgi:hypothetical protein
MITIILPFQAISLDNGLALTPPMGLKPDFPAGTETGLLMADFLTASGLLQAGYCFINTDAGWAQDARNKTTGELIWSPQLFPSGLPMFITELHSRGFKFGEQHALSLRIQYALPRHIQNALSHVIHACSTILSGIWQASMGRHPRSHVMTILDKPFTKISTQHRLQPGV